MERADLIEQQLASAERRRSSVTRIADTAKPSLLIKNESRWTRTISKYATGWTFDRGFVFQVQIDPYLFLEYGDYLLANEPIRSVRFTAPEDDVFPMQDLARSELLRRLTKVWFDVPSLTASDLETFAASPHLENILMVWTERLALPPSVFDLFARTPETRKMLSVYLSTTGFPGSSLEDTGRDNWWGAPLMGWTELTPQGKSLEAVYGYIPWLHPKENECEAMDAAFLTSNGILPAKPAGSRT